MSTRAAKSLGVKVPLRSLRAFSAREFDLTCTWADGPGFYISRLWRDETEFLHRPGSDQVKHSSFVTRKSRATARTYSASSSKWLDPVATAPGSVPTDLFLAAQRAKPLFASHFRPNAFKYP